MNIQKINYYPIISKHNKEVYNTLKSQLQKITKNIINKFGDKSSDVIPYVTMPLVVWQLPKRQWKN
ncbi:TPA: hypothetical protein CPU00_06565 [Candidatus Gastranaerophilales bacterium HUM_18]|nr:MAG TPA: hypothetical protein CPU00_06565 [Candidatus Gastranaerophilales bacterium HUM_18]